MSGPQAVTDESVGFTRSKSARRAAISSRAGRTWCITGLTIMSTLIYMGLRDWSENHAFLINASDSLPNWAFLIEKNKTPKRGQYVFFHVPETRLITAHFGAHPKPFGKLVYGMPGDLVTRAADYVAVGGVKVAHLKPFTKRGEPLAPGPLGKVPQGCYFVATPHPDGFDSRYADIGFVCTKAVIGTGIPIL